MDSNNPMGHLVLSEIYVMQGRAQDALAVMEQQPELFRWQQYAIAYHALGREKESDAALSEMIGKYHTVSAFQIAEVYAFRNQPDEAFEWLERAYAQRDGGLPLTNINTLMTGMRPDPLDAAFLPNIPLPPPRPSLSSIVSVSALQST